MNKLATILGCAMALTAWLVPLDGAAYGDADQSMYRGRGDRHPQSIPTLDTIPVPVIDMVGTWTGIADAVSAKGYFHNVKVTLVIKDQKTLTNVTATTNSSNSFFRGTITFAPPYGSGEPLALYSKLESGEPEAEATEQDLRVYFAGDGFTGFCGMGLARAGTMNNMKARGGMTMTSLKGNVQFDDTNTKDGPGPSIAVLDLLKQ